MSLIAVVPGIHGFNQCRNDALIVGLTKLKARKPDFIVLKKFTQERITGQLGQQYNDYVFGACGLELGQVGDGFPRALVAQKQDVDYICHGLMP